MPLYCVPAGLGTMPLRAGSVSVITRSGHQVERHMELLLRGECSTDEPFVRVGACGQAQHPSSQVSIQVGT